MVFPEHITTLRRQFRTKAAIILGRLACLKIKTSYYAILSRRTPPFLSLGVILYLLARPRKTSFGMSISKICLLVWPFLHLSFGSKESLETCADGRTGVMAVPVRDKLDTRRENVDVAYHENVDFEWDSKRLPTGGQTLWRFLRLTNWSRDDKMLAVAAPKTSILTEITHRKKDSKRSGRTDRRNGGSWPQQIWNTPRNVDFEWDYGTEKKLQNGAGCRTDIMAVPARDKLDGRQENVDTSHPNFDF